MVLRDLKWSGAEKKIARRAFEAARDSALAGIVTEFKTKAAAVTTPSEMWELEDYLRERRREIEGAFDYRYSQLPRVFAQLICQGALDEAQLAGLSPDKLAIIHDIRSRLTGLDRPEGSAEILSDC
ncbi:MAG TPA: hypothetical protein VHN20_05825 [Beijerinckiaceae bacterium]|nr:hypothetical protein [Beijerinckiaceae bacterium]